MIAKIQYILLLFLFSITLPVFAQTDSLIYSKDATVVVRVPSQESIDKYNADKTFQYEEEDRSLGLMERLVWWLLEKLFDNINYSQVQDTTTSIWNYVIIPLAILIILLVILKFLGVNFSGIFGRKAKSIDLGFQVGSEDVNSSQFDILFAQALESKNYRLAVRYLYLKALQQLNDLQLIKWHQNKTNHSYINELSSHNSLQISFREKVFLFELIWYGEYQIQENEFEQIRYAFTLFNQKVKQFASV